MQRPPRRTLGRDDLVLSAGTIPNATFRERVAAARAGGFAAISVRVRDVVRAREQEGLTDDDLRALLDEHGLVVAEMEALGDWRPGAQLGRRQVRADEMLALAQALGARSISVVDGPGEPLPVEAAAAAFAALCDRAAALDLLLHLEFWPGSRVDLATAARIVEAADRPNGGILVDAWHLARTAGGRELLRTVPGGRILALQLCDSPLVDGPEPDYMSATLERRLLPGEGELDLVGLLRELDAAGCAAPISVEVWSKELAARPPLEVARRAGDAMCAVLARARGDAAAEPRGGSSA
ncbi:MAG TPA: sugar phosphate isomerase/epimerase [Candidatus Binatia bacterium]